MSLAYITDLPFIFYSYPYQVMETIQNMEDGMEPMEVMLKKAEMQVIGFSGEIVIMMQQL